MCFILAKIVWTPPIQQIATLNSIVTCWNMGICDFLFQISSRELCKKIESCYYQLEITTSLPYVKSAIFCLLSCKKKLFRFQTYNLKIFSFSPSWILTVQNRWYGIG